MNILQSDLLTRRRPIVCVGQSNIAVGYSAATEWPTRLQYPQDGAHCYNLYCHQVPLPAKYARNDTWHRIAPWQMGTSGSPTPVSGDYVGSWGIDLADGLMAHGVQAAICAYCIGGTSLAYWTPGVTGSQYSTIIAWIQARIAALSDPLDPVLVIYQGESGVGNGANWQDYMALIAAQMRTDLACADMGIVVVQLPSSYAAGATIAAQQATYVAGDARSRLAYAHNTTFIDDPAAQGLHIDVASGRRLAIGPNSGTTVKSVLSCIEELLA